MDDATGGTGRIVGGRVLWAGADWAQANEVAWADGRITDHAGSGGEGTIDAEGAYVLPGIVDLHGDAFERSLSPRGGVGFDHRYALPDNDDHLLAAGITTSYLSATDSWEPGLRSRQTLRDLIAATARRRGAPRVLVHVRHERGNTDDADELIGWIEDGSVAMLSFNDHAVDDDGQPASLSPSQVARSGLSADDLGRLQDEAIARRDEGRAQEERLAKAAAAIGCPTASHDSVSLDDLARDLQLGVQIAEFPTTIDLARRFRAEGIRVLGGAPNVVRGGSHLGNLSVLDAVRADAVDILCSDYHYPSLLQAPFTLVDAGARTLGGAWAMVSDHPARAAGLADRGRIEPGGTADLVVVDRPEGDVARIRAVVVDGHPVLLRP